DAVADQADGVAVQLLGRCAQFVLDDIEVERLAREPVRDEVNASVVVNPSVTHRPCLLGIACVGSPTRYDPSSRGASSQDWIPILGSSGVGVKYLPESARMDGSIGSKVLTCRVPASYRRPTTGWLHNTG